MIGTIYILGRRRTCIYTTATKTLLPGLALKQIGITLQVSYPLFTNLEIPELQQPLPEPVSYGKRWAEPLSSPQMSTYH